MTARVERKTGVDCGMFGFTVSDGSQEIVMIHDFAGDFLKLMVLLAKAVRFIGKGEMEDF